jgi:amidohydrolase
MPTKEELKAKVCQEIDRMSDDIIRIAQTILEGPETGFREVKTSHLVAQTFTELGLTYRDGLAITGVKAVVTGGQGSSNSPTVGILGELDSVIAPPHPKADPQTGAAHACGHHAQIGMLIGVATAIVKSGVLPFLGGRIAFMAVPAEEYIEIEFREDLRKEGKLSFLGGKAELIKLGEFDDIDMAMMTHTTCQPEDKKLALGGTHNGLVAKQIQFIGRGAHAGGVPHKGINALNASMIALLAIHTQRETFRDDDTVRVHPIITRGGEVVNVVPDDVRIETYVRGKTIEAIKDASEKVDRALRAGALAVGGKVRITTIPGYLTVINDPSLQGLFRSNAVSLVGADEVTQKGHTTGSTDMGDVSHIMPAIHPYAGGATGTSHGSDFLIQDYEVAVLNPAKVMAMIVIDLLADDAAKGKDILSSSKPDMTKKEYLAFMDSLRKEEEYQG